MNIKTVVSKLVFVGLALAAIAYAAPKGDSPPEALNGRLLIQAYDGGTGGRTRIPLFTGQNSVALYNNGNADAGTAQTFFCGWEHNTTTVQNYPLVGFPVPYLAKLTVDITATSTASTGTYPRLYCAAATGILSEMEARYMTVK